MIRALSVLLALLLLAGLARAEQFTLDGASPKAQAADTGPIDVLLLGASAKVTQPHVVAELIPEYTVPILGKPFQIALHLHMDPQWHTYWINPGDAGMATTIKWTLPDGYTAGPILWPTPQKEVIGGLTVFGYSGDAYLLTTITPPADQKQGQFTISAKVQWLVCQEACIPGKGEFTLALGAGAPQSNEQVFLQARARLPVPNTKWKVSADYEGNFLSLRLYLRKDQPETVPKHLSAFFLEQPNVIALTDGEMEDGTLRYNYHLWATLQANGDKPGKLSAVIVADEPLIGDAKSVRIDEFPVNILVGSAPRGPSANAQPLNAVPMPAQSEAPTVNATPPAAPMQTAAATSTTSQSEPNFPRASGEATQANNSQPTDTNFAPTTPAPPAPAEVPFLPAILAAAFLGGIILNLMPCVLPVLSLKVFSLIRHAGEDPKAAWKQGAAFTAGVLISFWVLAGLLIAFNSAGSHLGWGFQMQSPGFVLALILLFFLLALNLFGLFEIGTSLVGLDAKAAANADRSHASGLVSSFGNGALATLAATPCTAPFMGSALGFAAQQPAYIALFVFTFLALGMASPYLLLTIFPGALKFVPKPGEWMVALKQFMGFLLMGTVIFLVYVFIMLVGNDQLAPLLGVLLVVSCVAWAYGRWGLTRTVLGTVIVFVLYASAQVGLFAGQLMPLSLAPAKSAPMHDGWQPWSPEAVTTALDQDKPVFVDFTAAWCLSCKVNEKVALDTDAVKKAFADKNVVLLKGDWTHADPQISATLQQYNRAGVPLYLVYSPKAKDAPQVLPEIITPGIVLDALNKL